MPSPDYKFTNTWFEKHTKSVWEDLLLPEVHDARAYLEIGVCEGRSMIWALNCLEQLHTAIGIDLWANGSHYENGNHNILEWSRCNPARLFPVLLTASSQEVLRDCGDAIPDEEFDLIYVDGSHLAHDALTDYVLCWFKLKVGGIMVMDDYNRRWHMGRPHSHEAIDAFLHGFEKRYDEHFVIRNPRQVAVRRIK